MADTEQLEEEVEVDTQEVDTDDLEVADDSQGDDEITYEQAMKWKQDLSKASAKLAALKKEEKESKGSKEAKQPTDSQEDIKMDIFFLKNPDLLEDEQEIREMLQQDKYKSLTPKEAQTILKANKPVESKTIKRDFTWGWYKEKPKDLTQLSDEEALKLSPHDYLKWDKANWEL